MMDANHKGQCSTHTCIHPSRVKNRSTLAVRLQINQVAKEQLAMINITLRQVTHAELTSADENTCCRLVRLRTNGGDQRQMRHRHAWATPTNPMRISIEYFRNALITKQVHSISAQKQLFLPYITFQLQYVGRGMLSWLNTSRIV